MTQERWTTQHDGRTHEVRVDSRRGTLAAEWRVDGAVVAQGRVRDKKLVLVPDDVSDPMLGAVGVQAPRWFGVTRRVVWLPGEAVGSFDDAEENEEEEPDFSTRGWDTGDDSERVNEPSPETEEEEESDPRTEARLHLELTFSGGTVDLEPEPESRAAARLDWIARHPRLHVAWSALTGGGWIACLFLFGVIIDVLEPHLPQGPDIEGPNLSQYLPEWDLPRIPFPDLPSIDLPDLPQVPDWLGMTLKVLLAVSIAAVAASSESKRWRKRRSPETADSESDGEPGLTGS